MEALYIFGTGGFAKEVCFLVGEINKYKPTFELKGFIDVKTDKHEIVIGNNIYDVFEEEFFFETTDIKTLSFAVGIGNPKILESISSQYLNTCNFPNLVHPYTRGLFETIEMGKGNIITAGCILTLDIKIGSLNIINLNTTIGHDVRIGNCNVINPGVNVSGGVNIGDNNLIGTNTAILQSVSIGNNNIVGAGAMVNTSIKDNKVAVGIPVKVIKDNV